MTAQSHHDMNTGTGFSIRLYDPGEVYAMPPDALAELFLNLQSSFVELTACVSETSKECEILHGRCKGLESDIQKLKIENKQLRSRLFVGNANEKLTNLTSDQGGDSNDGTTDTVTDGDTSEESKDTASAIPPDPDCEAEKNPEKSDNPERTELEQKYAEFKQKASEVKKKLDALHPPGPKGRPVRGKNTDQFLEGLPHRYEDFPVSDETLRDIFDNGCKTFGEPDEIEELIVEPAKVYVLVHRIPKFVGKRDGEDYVYEPAYAIDNKLLPGSICSCSLLTYFLDNKYSHGMPVTRILGTSEMQAVNLAKQRVYGWIHVAACLFAPLVFRALQLILATGMIQMDETYSTVLVDGVKKTGYYWVIRTGAYEAKQPMAVMIFALSRAEYVLEMILGWMPGVRFSMDTDGHTAYRDLSELHPDMVDTHGTCWSHARRKVVNALNVIPNIDQMTDTQLLELHEYQMLIFIARLFNIDMPLSLVTAKERSSVRNEQSRPVVEDFFNLVHLLDSDPKLDRGSKLGEAVTYCINQEKKLRAFLEDPNIPLSNNASEQLMIWLAMGRCGWKMSSSPKGAMDNAICYSVSYLAKLAGIDTEFYFQYLLKELPGVLRELGIPEGCEYDTFLDTFVMEHMRKGADKDLTPEERKRLREEAMDKVKAQERMQKQLARANIPGDLSKLDRLMPNSPEVRKQEREYLELKRAGSSQPGSSD